MSLNVAVFRYINEQQQLFGKERHRLTDALEALKQQHDANSHTKVDAEKLNIVKHERDDAMLRAAQLEGQVASHAAAQTSLRMEIDNLRIQHNQLASEKTDVGRFEQEPATCESLMAEQTLQMKHKEEEFKSQLEGMKHQMEVLQQQVRILAGQRAEVCIKPLSAGS